MTSRFAPPRPDESFEQEPAECEDCQTPFYPDMNFERGEFERKCEMCRAHEENEKKI